ncbi:hypothetical protein SAMN05192569_105514 [Parageobacillus thermantarcticus]|uniref:Uncharacterized protein n=1 Tax=Parageobacillus thermantarcticus TaxID=186116 RepID=A0A1I0TT61_9BACL|nr:hypothetical protein [Parageobacillus thermantarcticus]SFA54773.1 hypothetical protein SAMN05192569_105514 [Parageobacillus thermantarcticus]
MKKYLWLVHWDSYHAGSFQTRIVTDKKDIVKAIEVFKQVKKAPIREIDINRVEFISEVYM